MQSEPKFTIRKPWGVINRTYSKAEFIEAMVKGVITDECLIVTEAAAGWGNDQVQIREFKQANSWIADALAERKSQQENVEQESEKRQQQQMADEQERLARTSPAADVLLQVRSSEGIEPGFYLAGQISQRLASGALPISAEFKHPDYGDWFPCATLISDENLKGIEELRKEIVALRVEMVREIGRLREQTEKVKWATRIGALAVLLVVFWGFRIVLKW